jgi:hypothetical protein
METRVWRSGVWNPPTVVPVDYNNYDAEIPELREAYPALQTDLQANLVIREVSMDLLTTLGIPGILDPAAAVHRIYATGSA